MACVFKKKDGRVGVKHKIGDKWVYEYLGRGQSAEELAKIKCFDLNQATAEQAPAGIKFAHIVGLYLDSRVHMSQRNKNVLLYRFSSSIFPLLGALEVTAITHAELNRYIAVRKSQTRDAVNRKTGGVTRYGPPSMATIQNEINIVMTVLNFAAYRSHPPIISENPAKGFLKGKVEYEITDPPTEKELAAILSSASPHLARALILDVMCGARPGVSELFRIKWADVDLIGNTIRVASAKKGGIAQRFIPLSRSLREHLLVWREEDLATGDQYLIHFRGKPVASLQTSWEAAKRRAGVTRKLRLYDARHYFVTSMLLGGADLKSVSSMVGHADTTMVLRTYQHLSNDLKRAAIDKIPDIPLGNYTGNTIGNTGNTTAKNKIKNIR